MIAKCASVAHCCRVVTEISCSCKVRDSNTDGLAQIDPLRLPLHCTNNDSMGAPALCGSNRFRFDIFLKGNSSSNLPDFGKFLDCVIILFLPCTFLVTTGHDK